MTATRYTYNNRSDHAGSHHDALAKLLDRITQDSITTLLDLPGTHCLDVGAGAGSIARWLADRFGPHGAVTALDLDTALLSDVPPNVVVLRHDITEGPVPGGGVGFDLVNARTVLNHLAKRHTALDHMVRAVKPGGLFQTADFIPTEPEEFVAHATTAADARLLQDFQRLHLEILANHGNDRTWSYQAAGMLGLLGLVDVRQVPYDLGEWRGGGPGCQLLTAGLRQVQPELEALGFGEADCDATAALLGDPHTVIRGYVLHSVSGRKAELEDT